MSGEVTFAWVPRTRDFQKEHTQATLVQTSTSDHPLTVAQEKAILTLSPQIEAKEVKGKDMFVDPLSGGSSLSQTHFDPLLGEYQVRGVLSSPKKGDIPTDEVAEEVDNYPSWDLKKAPILAKYTTNKTIPVPSFVQGAQPPPNATPATAAERVKDRLEQLGDEDDGEMLQLTQKEYQRHIEKKRESLFSAWDGEKRVRALKIAIKCSKLLGNTYEVVQFYPSKFVMITNILDTFGDLVFERIKERSTIFDDDIPIPLKDNFRCEDVADTAKETCKNWFFKIASIRELIPRILVEMAIVRSYRFLENETFPSHFDRLNKMIRGIADPLVALYCRVYLARKGREVMRHSPKTYLYEGFNDFVKHMKLFRESHLAGHIEDRGVTTAEYFDLFTPGMEYLLECMAFEEKSDTMRNVLSKYKECPVGVFLKAILQSFQPRTIASTADRFVKFTKELASDDVEKIDLYRTIGLNLGLAEPPYESRVKILNHVWKDVTEEKRLDKYLETAEVWISYPLTYLSWKETNIMLHDILNHVMPEKKYFDHQPILQSIMNKVLTSPKAEFGAIFAMPNFLPFLDLFRGDTQTEVNKALLETFTKTNDIVSDMVTINTMFSVAKTVHDSVTAMSFDDDKREISALLKAFLRKLDFGKDLDKQLNFYVEARRAFANLDAVKVALVKAVCLVAVQTLRTHQLSKASAFLRACIAYCFITIPSIESEFDRLYLYVWAGHISLLSQSLPQADEMFKSAINLIQEVPEQIELREGKWATTSNLMVDFLKYFVSVLVSVPGHPSHGPFYLLEALLKVIKVWAWEAKSAGRVSVYTSVLLLLATNCQKTLPYKWDNVDSNDVLYGHTKKHLQDIQTLINKVVKEIMNTLEEMGQSQAVSKNEQASVIFELIQATLIAAEQSPECIEFVLKLAERLKGMNQGAAHLPSLIAVAKSLPHTNPDLIRRLQESTQLKVIW